MTIHGRNWQPDDPGIEEFPEPDAGHYPGWLTAIIWLVPILGFWGLLIHILK